MKYSKIIFELKQILTLHQINKINYMQNKITI